MKAVSWISLIVLTAATGCAGAQNNSFVIVGVADLAGSASCVAPATLTTALTRGGYDVALGAKTAPYFMNVVVANGIKPATAQAGPTDANAIQVTSASCTTQTVAGATIEAFNTPVGGGIVSPGGGMAGLGFPIFDSSAVAMLAGMAPKLGDSLDAKVSCTLHGSHLGGGAVNTPTVYLPLHVCNGCILQDVGDCPVATATMPNPCNVAQDTPVSCCNEHQLTGRVCAIPGIEVCPGPMTFMQPCSAPPPIDARPPDAGVKPDMPASTG